MKAWPWIHCPGCHTALEPARPVCPGCGRCPGCGALRAKGADRCGPCQLPYCHCCGRCPRCLALRYSDVTDPCGCGHPDESRVAALVESAAVAGPTAGAAARPTPLGSLLLAITGVALLLLLLFWLVASAS